MIPGPAFLLEKPAKEYMQGFSGVPTVCGSTAFFFFFTLRLFCTLLFCSVLFCTEVTRALRCLALHSSDSRNSSCRCDSHLTHGVQMINGRGNDSDSARASLAPVTQSWSPRATAAFIPEAPWRVEGHHDLLSTNHSRSVESGCVGGFLM